MLSEVGESHIGEEKEACIPVNNCKPYGGQPVQVSWRKREELRLAESSMGPISSQLCEPA